jgi:hypothetical protein
MGSRSVRVAVAVQGVKVLPLATVAAVAVAVQVHAWCSQWRRRCSVPPSPSRSPPVVLVVQPPQALTLTAATALTVQPQRSARRSAPPVVKLALVAPACSPLAATAVTAWLPPLRAFHLAQRLRLTVAAGSVRPVSLARLVATQPLAPVAVVVEAAKILPTLSSPAAQVAAQRCYPVALLVLPVRRRLPAQASVVLGVAVVLERQVVPVPVPHTAQVAVVQVGATTASRLAPAVLVAKASF